MGPFSRRCFLKAEMPPPTQNSYWDLSVSQTWRLPAWRSIFFYCLARAQPLATQNSYSGRRAAKARGKVFFRPFHQASPCSVLSPAGDSIRTCACVASPSPFCASPPCWRTIRHSIHRWPLDICAPVHLPHVMELRCQSNVLPRIVLFSLLR